MNKQYQSLEIVNRSYANMVDMEIIKIMNSAHKVSRRASGRKSDPGTSSCSLVPVKMDGDGVISFKRCNKKTNGRREKHEMSRDDFYDDEGPTIALGALVKGLQINKQIVDKDKDTSQDKENIDEQKAISAEACAVAEKLLLRAEKAEDEVVEKDKEIALLKAMVSEHEAGARSHKKELEDEKKRVYDKVKSQFEKGNKEFQKIKCRTEELLEEVAKLEEAKVSDQEKAAMASKHIATLKVRSAKARDMFLSLCKEIDPKADIGVDVKNDAKLLQRAKETLAHSAKMTKELKSKLTASARLEKALQSKVKASELALENAAKMDCLKGKNIASVENELEGVKVELLEQRAINEQLVTMLEKAV